jgi:hypothetical protein
MRLPGHSGCKFEYNDKEKLVLKSTDGNYSTERFLAQAEKQKAFYEQVVDDPHYSAPFIYITSKHGSEACMLMEIVDGYDWIEFLSIASTKDFQYALNLLTSLLFRYWGRSYVETVSRRKFDIKYDGVCSNVSQVTRLRLADKWRFIRPHKNVLVPLGACHGDFTLSNMMIEKASPPQKLIIFDFMETFLDSPMQDLVKLRQDTHHHWTLSRYPGAVNETKVFERLQEMDEVVINLFEQHMNNYSYHLFQFMNLIRILPYAKERTTVEYVFEQLERIYT